MTRILRLLCLLTACCAVSVSAQTRAFNDTFTGSSRVNSNPAEPSAPSVNGAAYQQLSAKAYNPNPPTVTAGNLRFGIASTSSGFNEIEVLFTNYPVRLENVGDYLELRIVFAPSGIVTAQASSGLYFGLYDAGQVQPIPGGMNGTVPTATAGYAQNWQGYVNRLYYTGGGNGFFTRSKQDPTAANNQDVLYSFAGATMIGKTATSTLAAFTPNSLYTEVYRITKNSAAALVLKSDLYAGDSAAGSPLYTQTVTSTTTLTSSFDAFAIGWRATGSVPSYMDVKSVQVVTNATTTILPEITSQPLGFTKTVGDSAPFSVVADGGRGTVLSYQWRKDGVDIPGATDPDYTIPSVTLDDAGDYTVLVTDIAGATLSAIAKLEVTTEAVAPSVSAQPVGGTILAGGSHTFSVIANGTAPLSYQWERSTDGGTVYSPIDGATNSSFEITDAVLTDAALYRVVVTNALGSATSTGATLIVNQAPVITSDPLGGSIAPGSSITLSVTAGGMPAPTYQWRRNGVAIAGATAASYQITDATGADTANYTVVASNSVGSVTSAAASVAVVSATMAATEFTSGAERNPDTRLTITFDRAPTIGVSGLVRIYDASNNAVVDTIDLVAATALRDTLRAGNPLSTQALPVQTKTIGGITNFNYYPITVSGLTATIYPRNGVLVRGRTYYVKIDAGVFVDSAGESFAGIADSATWQFTTRMSSPWAGATNLTVAADGSGDFDTVQGALDYVPLNSVVPTVIHVKSGNYFEQVVLQSRHFVTLVGESIDGTVINYPNNAAFNSAPGAYHRATFFANAVHDFTIANLTVNNTTPQNGTQAEAFILSGTGAATGHNIVTRCRFFSYQDTVQLNKQTYVSDSTILGDVDFLWGDGPVFFENCDIRILRSGAYFTQVRNGSGNHGYVFVNCRFTAPAGITGTFLGRIDPVAFPYNEVVVLDSTFGDATNNAFLATTTGVSGTNYLAAWWMLNNATSAAAGASVHNWTNNLVSGTGAALTSPNLDAFTTMPPDATTQANYRNVAWVLNTSIAGTVNGSWNPARAPSIIVPPAWQTVDVGQAATFSVTAFAIPTATYQWRRNGVDISGATGATFTVDAVTTTDAGVYSVVVANSSGSIESEAAPLVVRGGPPVMALPPANTSGLRGATATLNAWAVGEGPFTYQWTKDGAPLPGATWQSLRLTGIQDSDAGSYAVAVTNAGGTTTSASATLSIVAPATTLPTVPVIPAGVFDVTTYGAIGDGATDNTAAIQAAIEAARVAGGGTIEFPPARGAYLSGPITIYSFMNLQVDSGATLRALPRGSYPNSFTAPAHFVNVIPNANDVEFSGGGTIDGDGAAWWAAYEVTGPSTPRFRLIQSSTVTRMLFTGVTFSNSPTFHLAFRGPNLDHTIYGVTVSAPGGSPNTDGMDICGTNILVQNCSVSCGDDDIVAKPGGTFCRNIYIADCFIGTGHGISVGGQTNVGLDGMVVTNCTFDGTSSALRLKADPTQGGPVQNITYSDITMRNVMYPILFYSYYNQLGSPGATSGTSQTTPAKVRAWNATPPNASYLGTSTVPIWKNITVRNLNVINGSGYSTIWGLPLASAFIQNVRLENVNIQGGAGLELYDAANVQLVGANNVGPIITCNALAITSQPQSQTTSVGGTATFTVAAVGGSGVDNTEPAIMWMHDGVPLVDGAQADGSTVSGATTSTLTVSNLRRACAGNYVAVASTALDIFDTTNSVLLPAGTPVSATSEIAVLTVPDPFALWSAGHGLDPAGNGAADSDPDGDGVSNLLEFALGGDPTISDPGILPSVQFDAGATALLVTFDQAKDLATADGTTTVEFSTDLTNWTAAVAGQNGVTRTVLPVDSQLDQVLVEIPATGSRMFARVRVTR
ncbi:MAG TPA: pectinesterase family protein [Opitutaceae bacterium]|nr:pectinesterase family protein [Opitutaceae bacterium]